MKKITVNLYRPDLDAQVPKRAHKRLEASWQRVKRDFFPDWKARDWTCKVLPDQILDEIDRAEGIDSKEAGPIFGYNLRSHRTIYIRAWLATHGYDGWVDSVVIHEICHVIVRFRRRCEQPLAWCCQMEKAYRRALELKRDSVAGCLDLEIRRYCKGILKGIEEEER